MQYKYLEENHGGKTLDSRRLFGSHTIYLIEEGKDSFLVAFVDLNDPLSHAAKAVDALFYRAPAPTGSGSGRPFIPNDDAALRALAWVSCQTGRKLDRKDFPGSPVGIYDQLELTVAQSPGKFRGETFIEKMDSARAARARLASMDGQGYFRNQKCERINARGQSFRRKRLTMDALIAKGGKNVPEIINLE